VTVRSGGVGERDYRAILASKVVNCDITNTHPVLKPKEISTFPISLIDVEPFRKLEINKNNKHIILELVY